MIESESFSFSTPNDCGRCQIDGTFLLEPKVHVSLLNQPPCGSLLQIWALSFPSAQPHVSLDLLLDVQATLRLFFRTPARVLSCSNGATRLQVGARLRAALPTCDGPIHRSIRFEPEGLPFQTKIDWKMDRFRKGGRSAARRRAQLVGGGSRGPETSNEPHPETARGDDGRRGSAPARLSGPGRFDHEGHGSKRDRCHGIPSNTWRKKRHAHQSREARCACNGSKRRTSAKGTCTEPSLDVDWRARCPVDRDKPSIKNPRKDYIHNVGEGE